MKNGKKKPADLDDIAELLRTNNALLIEQMNHLIHIAAHIQTILVWMPSCFSDRKPGVGHDVLKIYATFEKRLRREANKRLKKLGF
jgi:hypothetical protein